MKSYVALHLLSSVLWAKPLVIEAKIADKSWRKAKSISPLVGQSVSLRVDSNRKGEIRWYQIIPDLNPRYKNANHPWESNPYQWVGFGEIHYHKVELEGLRNQTQIEPLKAIHKNGKSIYYRNDVGSFWFQVVIDDGTTVWSSPGLESNTNKGLSPQVFRLSLREGDDYLGYLSSYYNVPGLFGSVTYQSRHYIGVDCADVLVAAAHRWKGKRMTKNYNVAMLTRSWKRVAKGVIVNGQPQKPLLWNKDFKAGDVIAVKYHGARKYQHIGALYQDRGIKGTLDPADVILHAGPHPLLLSTLQQGGFDGEVVILRP